MRLFDKPTAGRVSGLRSCCREARASARPAVSFSDELRDAIDGAVVSSREADDDGPRVLVLCHALRGAFIFDREEAERRIRKAFPELPDADVARGLRHLESRVRVAARQAAPPPASSNWVHGWRRDE